MARVLLYRRAQANATPHKEPHRTMSTFRATLRPANSNTRSSVLSALRLAIAMALFACVMDASRGQAQAQTGWWCSVFPDSRYCQPAPPPPAPEPTRVPELDPGAGGQALALLLGAG